MKDASGAWIGLGIGDTSEEIRAIRAFMRGKFSYARLLDDTPVYDEALAAVVSDMQQRYVNAGKLRAGDFTPGVINAETKYVMGYLARPSKQLPVIFTIQGHMGGMFDGPAYFTARWLEERSLVRVQPVGYDNVALPFRNQTGIDELHRLVHDPAVLPLGTRWAMLTHSQGSIVGCSYYLDRIRPQRDRWPFSHFKGGINFGNPYREQDRIAPWVPDPPRKGTRGISSRRMDNTPPEIAEVSRTGDLYAECENDDEGEYKTAVYRAVMGDFVGRDTLSEQIWELVRSGGTELWDVFKAIADGVRFLRDSDPHGWFDLGPCIDHTRRILAV